jgi:O-antigen ligase
MTPHLKAFILVFVVSALALFFFRAPFARVIGARRFDLWRNLWLAATACLFLIPNFWALIAALILLVAVMSRADPLKPAIFALLMFVAPATGDAIPGFAGINKFITVTPPIALSAVLLIPALLSARAMKPAGRAGGAADALFMLYLAVLIILSTRAPSITHMLRTAIESFLAIAPYYYVFSRYPKSFADIRVISAAYLLPVLILCVVAIPEFFRNWHLYTSVATNWFGAMPFTYTMRDGFLRTSTSVIDPIVWGTVAMTGVGVGLAFFNENFSKFYKTLAFALIAFGLIVSLSRGPWLGALTVIAVFVLISPRAPLRVAQLGGGGLIAFLVSMATPFGQKIIDLLPFIGDSATDTISYRQALLKAAREVMAENPILGSPTYLENPKLQGLRQGQGIIDIVNSYLQIGLESGFVGLSLFVGVFAFALLALRGAMKSARTRNPALALYCRAYFATICGILVTIFTTSSVYHIPIICWVFAGMAIAIARIENRDRDNPQTAGAIAAPAARKAVQFDWK